MKKDEILRSTIAQIKKLCPESTVGLFNEIGKDVEVQRLSTGSLSIDACIGGGIPKGRIITIVGHTSSGKTSICLTTIAEQQRQNPDSVIMYIDSENAIDLGYAERLGVSFDNIILIQPSSGEEGFIAAETFLASGIADFLVIDSIATMTPRAVLDNDFGQEVRIGSYAKLIGQGLAKINSASKKSNCTTILINQWKPRIQTNRYAPTSGLGGSYYMSGENAIGFMSSQILEVRRTGVLEEPKGTVISSITKLTCKKNKTGMPFRTCEFYLTYNVGPDKIQEIITFGMQYNLIQQSGSFYQIPDFLGEERIRSRRNLVSYLKENPVLVKELEEKIRNLISDVKEIVLIEKEDKEIEEFEESEIEIEF